MRLNRSRCAIIRSNRIGATATKVTSFDDLLPPTCERQALFHYCVKPSHWSPHNHHKTVRPPVVVCNRESERPSHSSAEKGQLCLLCAARQLCLLCAAPQSQGAVLKSATRTSSDALAQHHASTTPTIITPHAQGGHAWDDACRQFGVIREPRTTVIKEMPTAANTLCTFDHALS